MSAIVAACLMLVASARAGIVNIDSGSSVSYNSGTGQIVGDYFGTFQGVVPAGGFDTFDQTFAIPGSSDDVLVSLFSYIEDPEPLPIFDGVLGVGSGQLVEGTNGGGGGKLNNYTFLYSPTQGLTEDLAWSLSGDSLAGGGDWTGTWSVTWTVNGSYVPATEFSPAFSMELDAPPSAPSSSSASVASVPDLPSTAILLALALAGLGLYAFKGQKTLRSPGQA
jgi:hypothetical protein